jgi:hypothetical protein
MRMHIFQDKDFFHGLVILAVEAVDICLTVAVLGDAEHLVKLLGLVPREFHLKLFGDNLAHAAKIFFAIAEGFAKNIKTVFGFAVVDKCDILKVPGGRNINVPNVFIDDILLNDERLSIEMRGGFVGIRLSLLIYRSNSFRSFRCLLTLQNPLSFLAIKLDFREFMGHFLLIIRFTAEIG